MKIKKTILSFDSTDNEILNKFDSIVGDDETFSDLRLILKIALRDKSLFSVISLDSDSTLDDYISSWISRYKKAHLELPSKKISFQKGTCSDPAINILVKFSTQKDDEIVEIMKKHHDIFMDAENDKGLY